MKFFGQKLTSLSKVDNTVTSNTFSIEKVFIFNFSLNLLDEFKNGLNLQDRARRALQLCRTSNLNPALVSFEKIQLNIYSHTFSIHFNTFCIVNVVTFNFSLNLLNGFNNGL